MVLHSMLPKLFRCFSYTAARNWLYRQSFCMAGLRFIATNFDDGTTMSCWVPKFHNPSKPTLVLIHGFGANAMWQYGELLHHFIAHFNVYVPDLIFFGHSFTSRPERTETFQAQCLMKLMEAHGVHRMSLVATSYGGFVGYSMAAQFPVAVDRLVLCCAGVCFEENDMENGLFAVSSVDEAFSILLPQTPDKLRELVKLTHWKPPMAMPSFILADFIQVMCSTYVQEKKELIEAILRGRQLSVLPKITQPTLIVWGEHDRIFPLELGYRLKGHIGESAEIAVIKNAGHSVILEEPKEFARHLNSFLIDDTQSTSLSPQFSLMDTIQNIVDFSVESIWGAVALWFGGILFVIMWCYLSARVLFKFDYARNN